QNLAVPARRDVGDARVLRGKQLFYQAGCPACHTPKFVTSRLADDEHRRFQLVWPYSDFLLHDMGEGLADGSTVGDAGPQEWR
ncbi:di-heme oxidoredictase family protein, partial [Vibrio cholerae]|uniref:di-heme oxidoredictase family protein n=1 Tax=Vibrio cholerae TaxID=666 RepID=UPI0017F8B7F7